MLFWGAKNIKKLVAHPLSLLIKDNYIYYLPLRSSYTSKNAELIRSALIGSDGATDQIIEITRIKGISSFDFIDDSTLVAQSLYSNECIYFFKIRGDVAYLSDSICGDMFYPTSVMVHHNMLIVKSFNGIILYDKMNFKKTLVLLNDFPSSAPLTQYIADKNHIYVFSSNRSIESNSFSKTIASKISTVSSEIEWQDTLDGELYEALNGYIYDTGEKILIFSKIERPFIQFIDKYDGSCIRSSLNIDGTLNKAFNVLNMIYLDEQNRLLAIDGKTLALSWIFHKKQDIYVHGFNDEIYCLMNNSFGRFDIHKRAIATTLSYNYRSVDILTDENKNQYLIIDSVLLW